MLGARLRKRLLYLHGLAAMMMCTTIASPASAACLPIAEPTAKPSGLLEAKFQKLVETDRFRDVPGNILQWQAFIEQARRDPTVPPEDLARSYSWLAWSLDYVDKTDLAIIAAREGERLSGTPALLSSRYRSDILTSLSMVEVDLGKIDEGAKHAQEALELANRIAGTDSAEASFAHNGLANIGYARGQYALAESEYRASTELAVKCLSADNPFIVNQMASHAGTLYMVGRGEDALAENERAANWALTHLTEENPVITLTLGNLGVMLRTAGRYAEAEAALRRVVDLEGRYQRDSWYYRAISLSNFASVIDAQGRHEEAEALWLKSREFHARTAIKRDPVTPAYPLRFAADAAQARGDLPLALARRAEAVSIMEKDAPADHPELARARIEYALTLMLVHQPAQASAMAEPAIRIIRAKLGEDDIKRMTAEIGYARIVAATSGAAAGYQIAAPIAARLERRLLDTSTARGDLLRYGALFSSSFATVAELALGSERRDEGFRALQLANLSDIVLVCSESAARAAAGDPRAGEVLRALQDKIRNRQSLDRARTFAASAGQSSQLAQLDTDIEANDAQIASASAEIDRLFPAYRQLGRPAPASLASFQARLLPGQVLLAPLAVEDGTLAIAVTREGLNWAKTPTTRAQVAKLVHRIRNAIETAQQTASDHPGFDVAAAAELYQAVAPPPIAAALRTHPDLLYYTGGALASVPPGLLVTKAQPGPSLARTPWLVRTHAITVLPTLLARGDGQQARAPSASRFLGVGAPDLAPVPGKPAASRPVLRSGGIDATALSALPSLPGAQGELRAIAAALGGSNDRFLVSAEATEAGLRALALDQYTVIAFATHGLVGNDFAGLTEPALVMTPPAVASGGDDGLLTASEIAGLRLDADWVILSACNSASGSGAGSPAYGGLASAFLQAGARALLVSHWPVRDDAAERITVETVRRTRLGESRAVALQHATLALIADRRVPQSANPAVWAPFVLIDH